MMGNPCGCGGSPSTTEYVLATREAQPHVAVVASYDLCLKPDDFILEKSFWVVDLTDGIKVFQDDDRPGIHTPSAWKRLGFYLEDHPHNKIKRMRLRFGTNIVELPAEQAFYYYSRGLVQQQGQTYGLDFHVVGVPNKDNPKQVVCTWFKSPELVVADQKVKLAKECQPGQLLGDIPT